MKPRGETVSDESSTRGKQRLFFALWPPPELGRALYDLTVAYLRPSARVIPADNIHLTLAFLGSVEARIRACAEQAASEVRAGEFSLTLERLGCWSKPGILWAGPNQTPDDLTILVQSLSERLVGCGYKPDSRPYVPHVSLARQVQPCPTPCPIDGLNWPIDRFHLVRSRTLPHGARYEIVRSWALTRQR